jgi:hypothetical protein
MTLALTFRTRRSSDYASSNGSTTLLRECLSPIGISEKTMLFQVREEQHLPESKSLPSQLLDMNRVFFRDEHSIYTYTLTYVTKYIYNTPRINKRVIVILCVEIEYTTFY